jgi:hypothetical protein
MRTLRCEKVGEYLIFDRFDFAVIDPEMTRMANQKALSELSEKSAITQKIAEKFSYEKKRTQLESQIRMARHKGNSIDSEVKSLETVRASTICCDDELRKLNASLSSKTRDILRNNPVFGHRRNEIRLSEDEYQELNSLASSLENEQIVLKVEWENLVVIDEKGKEPVKALFPKLVDYEKIPDLRGKIYFWKIAGLWEFSEAATRLGDVPVIPDNAIEKDDLTSEQLEEVRIQCLSTENKEIEKNQILAEILTRAAIMKSELEIQGDADALTKSQKWHKEQVQLIEEKYNG